MLLGRSFWLISDYSGGDRAYFNTPLAENCQQGGTPPPVLAPNWRPTNPKMSKIDPMGTGEGAIIAACRSGSGGGYFFGFAPIM